jgi:aminodeoxychorismate lyase
VNTPEQLWLDGRLVPAGGPHLDARDRGFTLGDGLFETIRVRAGRTLALERHLARLFRGLALVHIASPWTATALAAAVADTLTANALADAVVRLTISRGVPNRRGLVIDPEAAPTVAITVEPFTGYPPELYARGMRLVTSRLRRDATSPLTQVKSLSRLDLVLARHEATHAGANEALLLNTTGHLTGATAANLFLITAGGLVTPDLASGALPGVTRALILETLAPSLGLPVAERPVAPPELERADEVFLTSALLGVMPATALDGRPLGSDRPGRLTMELGRAYESHNT